MQRTSLEGMLRYALTSFSGHDHIEANIDQVSGAEAVLSKL